MENTKWFNLNSDSSDLENVLTFLDYLPNNIKSLISSDNSNFISVHIEKDDNYDIDSSLFFNALQESVDELELSLKLFRRRYKLDILVGSNRVNKKIASTMGRIGFVGNSLKLKAAILNKLWDKVVSYANRFTNGIIDFANNELVKLIRKFLEYLNSILGSLTDLIPGAEAIKEFKEIIESYLGLADE